MSDIELNIQLLKDPYLRSAEIAHLLKTSTWKVNKARSKLAIPRLNQPTCFKKQSQAPKHKPKPELPKLDQSILEDPEKLRELYAKHSAPDIAFMVSKNVRVVYKQMVKFGIPRRNRSIGTTFNNPCNNYDWLEEHYIIRKMSVRKMHKLAGVCYYTMANWLIKFGFKIRSYGECQSGELNPFYGGGQICKKKTEGRLTLDNPSTSDQTVVSNIGQ